MHKINANNHVVCFDQIFVLPWASYQIRKIAGCACAGNAGNVFPRRRFQRKPLVSDPDMHHGTCVTHVPWCMSGSLTCGYGENVPGIPGACAPGILRIWQEAHGMVFYSDDIFWQFLTCKGWQPTRSSHVRRVFRYIWRFPQIPLCISFLLEEITSLALWFFVSDGRWLFYISDAEESYDFNTKATVDA